MSNEHTNSQSLKLFRHFIACRMPEIKKKYDKLLAYDLGRHQADGCFQRNALAVMEQTYDDALAELHALPFDSSGVPVHRGLSDLSKQILATFEGFIEEFLSYALDKHRTCNALVAFPEEQLPNRAYVEQVKCEIGELWQSFALKANAYLLQCKKRAMEIG
jgi:hypothetical protein